MDSSANNILSEKLFSRKILFSIISIILISGALLTAYSNTFYSPFYFDDYGYVVGNPYVEINSLSFENLKDAALKSPGKMRAFANISFALNHYWGGKNVFGFHLLNFLIHASTAITAYFLFIKTLSYKSSEANFKNIQEIALLSALLWAVHPLQTNSVTYIIQRMNSMAGLFMLMSTLFYAHARGAYKGLNKVSFFTLSFFTGLMAIFSKENALMLPVLIGAYELFFISEIKDKKDIGKIIAVITGAVAFLFAALFIIRGGNLNILSGYAGKNFTLMERLLTEPRVIVFYLSLLILPAPYRLNLLHDFPKSASLVSPPQTIASILMITGLLFLLIWSYKRNRLLSFSLFWFFANLMIESSFLPLAIIFEHRTYTPSIFLSLALIAYCHGIIKKPIIIRTCAAVIIIILMTFTWQRNQVWRDSLSLWSDIARKSPNLSRGHLGMFFALERKGENIKARQALLKAVEVDPKDDKAMTNLVNAYINERKYRQAVAVLDRFLKARQTYQAYIDRAKAHAMLKQFDKTLLDAEHAIKIRPDSSLAWLIKGKSLSSLRQSKQALDALVNAQNLGLTSAPLFNAIGEVYINSGKVDLAAHYFKEAVKADPDNANAHYFLGLAYGKKGMQAEAKKEMEIGIYLRDNPRVNSNNPHDF